MDNITVKRYINPQGVGGWQGWIEPKDRSWIAFIDDKGSPWVYLNRDENGAVIQATEVQNEIIQAD